MSWVIGNLLSQKGWPWAQHCRHSRLQEPANTQFGGGGGDVTPFGWRYHRSSWWRQVHYTSNQPRWGHQQPKQEGPNSLYWRQGTKTTWIDWYHYHLIWLYEGLNHLLHHYCEGSWVRGGLMPNGNPQSNTTWLFCNSRCLLSTWTGWRQNT